MPTRRHFLLTLAALSASATALAPVPLAAQAPATLVATTGMVAEVVRRVTKLPVTALIGSKIDPHSHRPTRSDIVALARADRVFWHGLHLEAQFAPLMGELAGQKPTIPLAEALDPQELLADPLYPGRPDPHVWFDPALWAKVAGLAAKAVSDLTPAPEQASANAAAFQDEIARMRDYAAEVLSTIPPEARILITAHDAFAYLGRAFALEVEGVQGISTESEAGLARVGALVELIVARRVPAVFVESSVSDRMVRALVEGARARGHELRVGGELFSDAMGPEGSYEGTWAGMMDHNATTIARALGGAAPARGRDGRLARAAAFG